MTNDESVWQDVFPGDLISLPRGGEGMVIAVLPGGEPALENAKVTVLTTGGRIETFTKAVLGDEPLVERPPADHSSALSAALRKLPSDPDPREVVVIFESISRPVGDEDWVRLARRLEYLATFGR